MLESCKTFNNVNHILYIILRNTNYISLLIFADKLRGGDDTRVCFLGATRADTGGVCVGVSVSSLDSVQVPVGQSHGDRSLEVFVHITVTAVDVKVVIRRGVGVNLKVNLKLDSAI